MDKFSAETNAGALVLEALRRVFLEDGDRAHVWECFENDGGEEAGEGASYYDYAEHTSRSGAAVGSGGVVRSGHGRELDVLVVEADNIQSPYEAENGTWAVRIVDDMVHKQMWN